MLWNKDVEASYIVLTHDRQLYVGAVHKPLKRVMDEIDAVERSADGNLVAIVRKNILSFFSTNFKEILRILLPLDSWMDDRISSCPVKVDSIRWVRSDCIVVGCLQQTEDGVEENYFLQVIMSKDSKVIDGSSKLVAVCFGDVFPGVVDDIVPFGCGPHLFTSYLQQCEIAFVSNRKNTDQHIMLFGWSQENNQVSVVDIERDSLLPRIELQESGDDNLVLGICMDKTSVFENVNVKIGEEQRELPPHCILVCLTLEGKLIMFNFASIAGVKSSSLALSAPSDDAQSTPADVTSDLGGAPSLLEEDSKKQSAIQFGSCNIDARKVGFGLGEASVKQNLKPPDLHEASTNAYNSDVNLRKEPEIPSLEAKTFKPLTSGHSLQEISNQLMTTNSHVRSSNTVPGDGIETERWKVERHISMTDQSPGTIIPKTGKSMVKEMGPGVSQSTSYLVGSDSSSAIPGLSSARTTYVSPSTTKSTISGSVTSSSGTVNNAASSPGNSSYPLDSFTSSTGRDVMHGQKAVTRSGVTGISHGISSSEMQSQKGMGSDKSTGQSHSVTVNYKNISFSRQLNSEQKMSKQLCNVQNMTDELDRLLECIEKPGGFRDACTTTHRSLLETLEEGLDSLSEKSRMWQCLTEEQHREIQVLLDRTVQVLVRKTHIEGIIRQSTDGKYWDLWNRQKLSSELDLKRQSVSNLSQDLVNQMIGLEKHFNALELNLFGKSSGNDVSQALKSKSTPSRYIQSLHAIHKAMISQVAASQQLSDYLSRQMAVLSIKLSPEKQENVKKQLFESIGISDHSDCPGFPNTGKVIDSSSNKKLFVSGSDKAHNESRRNQLSSLSNHDPETARRRRDSLDRNWANFEAPKTTVKRMLVENQHQNLSASFPSLDKQLSSPRKLEPSTASCPKALPVRNRNGCMDVPKKLNSEDMASSIFKWAGEFPRVSRVETEGSSRLQALQGSNYSASWTSDLSSQSSSPTLLDLNIKKGNNHSSAGVPWTERGHDDKSKSAIMKDLKPSEFQNGYESSTTQRVQPQLLSSSNKSSEMPISYSKETAVPSGGRSSLLMSAHDAVSSTSEAPPMRLSSLSASSSPSQSVQALPFTSAEGGSLTSAKTVKDANSPMLQLQPSSSFVFPSIAHDSFFTSKDPEIKDSHSRESSSNSVGQSPKIDPQPTPNKVGSDTPASPASTPLPSQKLESFVIDGLKFESLTPSARSSDIPKEAPSGSPHALSRAATLASDVVSNTPSEKNSPAYTLPAATLSDSGGGKNIVDAAVTQEDEMEEEAPEPNSTADLSLGGLAGFGLGSVPNTTASRSNPFGVSVSSATVNTSSSISLSVPSGELFRPASFSFQSLQTSQQSQPASIGAPSGAFGSGNPPQQPSSGGFGQPGKIGSGQAALGSVLGSFGQSRQFGAALPGTGFGGNQSAGGFLNAPAGGGFASIAPTGGGFAGLGATASGFAAAGAGATGGGFAAAATGGGGFAAAASGGGGFAGAAGGGGGFGAFSKPGGSGFSGLGSGTAAGGGQPSSLFTQIRK